MSKKLQPRLRFKGFTDAWTQRKLGEVTDSYSGGTPSVSVKEYYGGGIPFIRSAEINSAYTELHLSESGLKNSSAKMVCKGQILYALYGATSGEVGIAQVAGAINQAILALDTHEDTSPEFLAQWLKKSKQSILDTYLQGGQGNLSAQIVKDLKMCQPVTISEQMHIGEFFRVLDDLIAINQRKYDLLQRLKHAYLQQLFPAPGQNMPRLRFLGFRDEWIPARLGAVADINPRAELPMSFDYVDLESVVGTTLVSHRTETLSSAPSRAQRLAKRGDIFFQTVRPYQQNNYLFDSSRNDFVFSTGYAQLRPKMDSHFLMAKIQEAHFVGEVLDRCTGTGYPAINADDLAAIIILVPSPPEQQMVGRFFQSLDRLIVDQNTEIGHLQTIKRGYLQQMFV